MQSDPSRQLAPSHTRPRSTEPLRLPVLMRDGYASTWPTILAICLQRCPSRSFFIPAVIGRSQDLALAPGLAYRHTLCARHTYLLQVKHTRAILPALPSFPTGRVVIIRSL